MYFIYVDGDVDVARSNRNQPKPTYPDLSCLPACLTDCPTW